MLMHGHDLRITTTLVASEVCANCGREWENHKVPDVYVADSLIDSTRVPEPVCDLCMEEHQRPRFKHVLTARHAFHADDLEGLKEARRRFVADAPQ